MSFSENLGILRRGCSFGFVRVRTSESEPNEDGRPEKLGREERSFRFQEIRKSQEFEAVVRVSPTANYSEAVQSTHPFRFGMEPFRCVDRFYF